MSRRRESFRPESGVTTDQLLTEMFGERVVRGYPPMPGCSSRCCAPAPGTDLDALIWQATVRVLTSEATAIVGAVLVVALLWRVIGGGR